MFVNILYYNSYLNYFILHLTTFFLWGRKAIGSGHAIFASSKPLFCIHGKWSFLFVYYAASFCVQCWHLWANFWTKWTMLSCFHRSIFYFSVKLGIIHREMIESTKKYRAGGGDGRSKFCLTSQPLSMAMWPGRTAFKAQRVHNPMNVIK